MSLHWFVLVCFPAAQPWNDVIVLLIGSQVLPKQTGFKPMERYQMKPPKRLFSVKSCHSPPATASTLIPFTPAGFLFVLLFVTLSLKGSS